MHEQKINLYRWKYLSPSLFKLGENYQAPNGPLGDKYVPAGANIVHDRYGIQFDTLPFNQNLHEYKPQSFSNNTSHLVNNTNPVNI